MFRFELNFQEALRQMFKKMLAKFGKDSATINLVLDQHEYQLGELITGQIIVKGGSSQQSIRKIEILLNLGLHLKEHDYTQLLQQIVYDEPFKLEPAQEKLFPFSYDVPISLFISGNHITYDLISHLDIVGGVDSSDRDHIVILPPTRLKNIFTALELLGFHEKYDSRSTDGHFQEFEFAPTHLFHDQVEEIEFNVVMEEQGIRLLLEIDLYTLFGEREVRQELFFNHDLLHDVEKLAAYLQQIIAEMIQNPSDYYVDKKHFQKKYSTGAIGGVVAGLIGAELLMEAVDETGDLIEDSLEDDEEDQEDEDFLEDDED